MKFIDTIKKVNVKQAYASGALCVMMLLSNGVYNDYVNDAKYIDNVKLKITETSYLFTKSQKLNTIYANTIKKIDDKESAILVFDDKYTKHMSMVNYIMANVADDRNIDMSGIEIINVTTLGIIHNELLANNIEKTMIFDAKNDIEPYKYTDYIYDYSKINPDVKTKINMSFGLGIHLSDLKGSSYIDIQNNIGVVEKVSNDGINDLIRLAEDNANLSFYISAGNANNKTETIIKNIINEDSFRAVDDIAKRLYTMAYINGKIDKNSILKVLKTSPYFDDYKCISYKFNITLTPESSKSVVDIDIGYEYDKDILEELVDSIFYDIDKNIERLVFVNELKKNGNVVDQFNIVESISIDRFIDNVKYSQVDIASLPVDLKEIYDYCTTDEMYIKTGVARRDMITRLGDSIDYYKDEYPNLYRTNYDSVLFSHINDDFNRVGVQGYITNDSKVKDVVSMSGTSFATPYVLMNDLADDSLKIDNEIGI